MLPFETNGAFWWVDVEPRRLGARGQSVSVNGLKEVGGMEGRGFSVEEWRGKKGRVGWSSKGLGCWELV